MADELCRYRVCQDCYVYVANDDLTGLDYSLSPEDAEKRARIIRKAVADIQVDGRHLVCGDNEDSFSWRSCECCGTIRGGSRHELILLSA